MNTATPQKNDNKALWRTILAGCIALVSQAALLSVAVHMPEPLAQILLAAVIVQAMVVYISVLYIVNSKKLNEVTP